MLGNLLSTTFSDSAVPDELMHVVIVGLSAFLVVLAIPAYLKRRSGRYLFLSLGFIFIFLSQSVTLLEVAAFSDSLFTIPYFGLHISHLFDFITVLSFCIALARN